MSNKCMDEIKKEDKKAFKGYVTILFIASVFGGILGFLSQILKKPFGENLPSLLINILQEITPFANLILSILVILISKVIYNNSRKGYELWKKSNEDDNSIDKIEENLSYLNLIASVNCIIGIFFYGVGKVLISFDTRTGNLDITKDVCFLVGIILCVTSTILIQKKIINFRKEMNPLLKGSIYDMKFSKKWLDSCDESAKLSMFKSSYTACTYVSRTCMILCLFFIIGYDLWNFGIMPIVIVTIIWLVQTISYCLESIKYSKTK
ncbi:DUF3169 family protein [Paraclostridium bifermentans]|uniref:DUF3169 family protein n=1 Tax=Paraclostridium bifermentans TaxID=1490 RepID=UPI0011595A82|nr:DUF3169 family protein [Paraclostridium bifermentans]MCE9676805.1 DUF3169 family protein [Paraclostridium bifermentans]TQO56290.1 DUF3169 family protein [Paraclostridium bifermentans]GKZ02946.1 hypothetical protein ANS014_13800 [Paraclostridium bifermentans]GKZ08517.1 hypothetical protein ANS015_34000 [Paraclostridium bifermentans]GKZ08801.1 hypothetical protein ANS017_01850 [Paraclostridium bifermentans]